MKTLRTIIVSTFSAVALLGQNSLAQVVYTDNFDAGTSAGGWTASLSHADASANFAYNYGAIGVPSAPNSTGGSTVGMNFLANQSAGVFQGVSASPNGFGVAGGFRMTFDMWCNYAGPLGVGGNGTTQFGSFGWGVTGTTASWASTTAANSGVMFAASLDGGSGSDYRFYTNAVNSASLVAYAAGSQNNSAAYYTSRFAGQTAPGAQLGLYPGQTGTTDAGEVAFKWFQVAVERVDNTMTWTIDGHLIASTTMTGVNVAGNNIFFGMFDSNAGSSTEANDFLITTIFDNVVVSAPEPSTAALLGLGLAMVLGKTRKK
jgi:hypothetical protein